MDEDQELADLVTQLCRSHPRFRRVTVERLVARAAQEYRDLPPHARLALVRRSAGEQLTYADGVHAR